MWSSYQIPLLDQEEPKKAEAKKEEPKKEEPKKTDEEEDLLDKAWGLEPDSRLSCQTIPEEGEYTVELPKYTINQVSEDH